MRHCKIFFGLLCSFPLVCSFALWDSTSSIELLLEKLGSENPTARAEARQLLALKPPLVVLPKLVPYLNSADPDIHGIAKNILFDLSNRVTKATLDERIEFTKQLLILFDDLTLNRSAREKILNALTLLIDEYIDISILKKYLVDPDWRESVRVTLVENGSAPAKQILCESLESLNTEDKMDILLGMAQINTELPCLESIQKYLEDSNILNQTTSALVLANTGRPQYEPALYKACTTTPPEIPAYRELWDAYIRLAENIIKNGGNWNLGIRMFQRALVECNSSQIQMASIISLCRFGDESVLPILESVLMDEQKTYLHEVIFSGMKELTTKAKRQWVADLSAKLPLEKQILLLPLLIENNNVATNDNLKTLFVQYPKHSKEVFLNYFFESRSLQCVNYIEFVEDQLDESEKKQIVECLWRAVTYHTEPDEVEKPLVSKAYFYLLNWIPPEEKNLVWNGIKKYPSVDLIEKMLPEWKHQEVASIPFPILFELYFSATDENVEMKEKFGIELQKRITEAKTLTTIVGEISNSKHVEHFSEIAGFVRQWDIIGPFPWDINQPFSENYGFPPFTRVSAPIQYKDKEYTWLKGVRTKNWGYVDLLPLCEKANMDCSFVCAFAVSKINVAEATDAICLIGSDDGYRLWVNQKEIAQKHVDRGMKVDEDKVNIHLEQGVNEILLQITQIRGGWNFCLRLTDLVGKPILFTYVSSE